jgi:phosphoglycerol transferase MdoB-like AlkP superfamily enzyme
MLQRLRFCFGYFAWWMVFFAVARGIFLGYNHAEAARIGIAGMAGAFFHGARMDMSAAAILSLLVFILVAISVFLPKIAGRVILGYSIIMIVLLSLLVAIDVQLFGEWGFRIDGAILRYVNTPREMLASAGSSPVVLLALLFVALATVAVAAFLRLFAPGIRQWQVGRLPGNLASFVLVGGLAWFLYYPGKGGFQDMPITQSTVYFSHDAFANQAAINLGWNFLDSIWWKTYRRDNPYQYLPAAEATAVADSLLASGTTPSVRLLKILRPNVMIIVWESFTAKVVERLGGVPGTTPNIDSLTHQGVLFDRFYATGDRSPEGLTGVIAGYPAQPTTEIIQHPRKSATLPGLPHDLARVGYRSTFYYGGDPEFTNFKSFILQAGFDSLVSKSAFAARDRHSSWGADDHVVLGRALADIGRMPRPFFVTLFTLSSHEPFTVPMETVIPGTDERSRFLNAHAYTDRSIGAFIRQARQQPWWDSTLIIILADHGHRLPVLDSLQPSRRWETFAIPMLWLGGALAVHDTVITAMGVQTDLPRTLLDQMGLDASAYRWSRDLLASGTRSWAWATFSDGFIWVNQAGGALAWDNVGKQLIASSGPTGPADIRSGEALLQALTTDYLKR